MQNEQQNTTTMNFYMTKTTKANGEHVYKVIDNTGRIHATRTSNREYVAATFHVMPEGQKPVSIENGIGRVDLVFKALKSFGDQERAHLLATGLTSTGSMGLAYLKQEPAPSTEPAQDGQPAQPIQDTVRCSIVILSHKNDYNIDGNGNHIAFIEYLENKFPDRSVEIDPRAEWAAWEDSLTDPDPEPQGPAPRDIMDRVIDLHNDQLAEASKAGRFRTIAEKTMDSWMAYLSGKVKDMIQELVMEATQESLHGASQAMTDTVNEIQDEHHQADLAETLQDEVAEEFTQRYEPSAMDALKEQLQAWRDMANEMLAVTTPEEARKAILALAKQAGTEGKQLKEANAKIQEQDLQIANSVKLIKTLQDQLIQAQDVIKKDIEIIKTYSTRIQELEDLLQDAQRQIQEVIQQVQGSADVDPGLDPGMALSDVMAAQTPEQKIYQLYLEHAKAANYPAGMMVPEDVFTTKLRTEGAVSAAAKVWRLSDFPELQDRAPAAPAAPINQEPQRPIAEREANLARRLQLLDDIRILEECGMIAIRTNDLGQPYLDIDTRTPNEGDLDYIRNH